MSYVYSLKGKTYFLLIFQSLLIKTLGSHLWTAYAWVRAPKLFGKVVNTPIFFFSYACYILFENGIVIYYQTIFWVQRIEHIQMAVVTG